MQKLDEALENPVCFDYCVDKDGNKFQTPIFDKYLDAAPVKSMWMYKKSYMNPDGTPLTMESAADSEQIQAT